MNPSGGLEAKGHPLGATGVGMHFYIMSEYTVSVHSYLRFTKASQCNYETVSDSYIMTADKHLIIFLQSLRGRAHASTWSFRSPGQAREVWPDS